MKLTNWSLRSWLRKYLDIKPVSIPAEPRADSGAKQSWASTIAISEPGAPFQPVGPVAQHVQSDPWISFDDTILPRPIADYVALDGWPLPATAEREGYHGQRHYDYWLSGLRDYLKIKQVTHRWGVALEPGSRVLELGCASGRVLRHFAAQDPGIELWGTDINLRHVEWMLTYLDPRLKVFQNTVLPHLPIPDNHLNLIYAMSVFTHIDTFELTWLAELHRCLRPGGMAYITMHTEHTWQIMHPQTALYRDLLAVKDFVSDYDITPDFLASPMPKPKTIIKWQIGSVNNSSVFVSSDHIRTVWGRFFRIEEIIREGSDYQDVIVLRKADA